MTRSASQEQDTRMLRRIQESHEQLTKTIERYVGSQVDLALRNNREFKTLQKQERQLRAQLHEDRINAIRKEKAVQRMLRAVEDKKKEAAACRQRIADNEKDLQKTLAEMETVQAGVKQELVAKQMNAIGSQQV